MNSLSLFLYLADVIGNLAVVSGILGVGTIFLHLALGLTIAAQLDKYSYSTYNNIQESDKEVLRKKRNKYFYRMAWCVPFFVFCAITPSQTTMYLIAGSEVGEVAIKTPEAQQIMDLIQQKIEAALKPVITP